MRLIEAKVVVEFTSDEAALLGHWIQWDMTYDNQSDAVSDVLKELGRHLLPESQQD